MPRRLAVAVALLVFALCLICGIGAGNDFAETVTRALKGMFCTLLVGLVVGAMAQKMLNENVPVRKSENSSAKPEFSPAKPESGGR